MNLVRSMRDVQRPDWTKPASNETKIPDRSTWFSERSTEEKMNQLEATRMKTTVESLRLIN